jgi:hypothetical protein
MHRRTYLRLRLDVEEAEAAYLAGGRRGGHAFLAARVALARGQLGDGRASANLDETMR